jgi:hypothetical protein
VAKKDLATINLSQNEVKGFTSDRTKIEAELTPRLSNRHCKAFLVNSIKEGAIEIPVEGISSLTYKAVGIKGVKVAEGISGKQKPVVELTKEQFGKLSPKEVAELIENYTTEKRAAYVVQGLLLQGLPITAKDLVYLCNGRVAVEGVALESPRKGINISVLISGVKIKAA